jgi:peptide/nickel transport system substrate-binding protein
MAGRRIVRLTHLTGWFLVVSFLAAACAGPVTPSQQGGAPDQQAGVKKRIVIAIMGNPTTLNGKLNTSGTGNIPGVDALEELVHAGLGNFDEQGELRALAAEAIPTVENGGWRVLPDGRMETTWKIRPNVLWHDGMPFTSEDLAFSARVGQEKDTALEAVVAYDSVERVELVDPQTFTIYWKRPYIEANTMFTRGAGAGRALPLPRHILEKVLDEDKATFTDHPYWTTGYVGVGPFKLREWVSASHLIVEANDRYFLGRPKLAEIEVRFFPDPRVLPTSILGGIVDGTMSRGLTIDLAIQVRDQWREGHMDVRPGNTTVMFPQFLNPTPVIVGNVQFRRALLHALDRQQLADSLMAGLSQPAHSFIPPDDALFKEVESSTVRYEYDSRRATQLIEELGFVRGSDGFFRDGAGERLSVEARATAGDDTAERAVLVTGDYWQRAGVSTELFSVPSQRERDREFRSTFPAFDTRQSPSEPGRLIRFHSSRVALPENRFIGENNPRYMSPELDSLLDRYFGTIPIRARNDALSQIMRHLSENVVQMGLFYNMEPTLVSNRITNLRGRHQASTQAWNVHEWDVTS